MRLGGRVRSYERIKSFIVRLDLFDRRFHFIVVWGGRRMAVHHPFTRALCSALRLEAETSVAEAGLVHMRLRVARHCFGHFSGLETVAVFFRGDIPDVSMDRSLVHVALRFSGACSFTS